MSSGQSWYPPLSALWLSRDFAFSELTSGDLTSANWMNEVRSELHFGDEAEWTIEIQELTGRCRLDFRMID